MKNSVDTDQMLQSAVSDLAEHQILRVNTVVEASRVNWVLADIKHDFTIFT